MVPDGTDEKEEEDGWRSFFTFNDLTMLAAANRAMVTSAAGHVLLHSIARDGIEARLGD